MKPQPVYKDIGANIRTRRRQADLSQETMALELGISRATLANIETGRQRILVHQLYDIAITLGVTPNDLLPPLPAPKPNSIHSSAGVAIDGDVNSKQKKEVLRLINSVGDSTAGKGEESNATKRNDRTEGAKPTR
jgi:transcriptional regulator with XRE-family HTH domain